MDIVSTQKKRGISGSTLKLIAIFTMLIDHIGASLIEGQFSSFLANPQDTTAMTSFIRDNSTLLMADTVTRFIGRIAFPIFCFLLVEGFLHTRNKQKYAIRLFLFALISEFPFDLAFYNRPFAWQHQNVFFTLFLGLLALCLMEALNEKYRDNGVLCTVLTVAVLLTACALAEFVLKSDYGLTGVLVIIVFYMLRSRRLFAALAGCILLNLMSLIEITAFLAILPIMLYNGSRGLRMKYIFYVFYPAHLLLLFLLCNLLGIY